MPERFIVEIGQPSFSNVQIIDEVGELPSFVVDVILSRGLEVNYWGVETKDYFSYLADNKRFNYLSSLENVTKENKIGYLLYFPKDEVVPAGDILNLTKRLNTKTLVSFSSEGKKIGMDKIKRFLQEENGGVRFFVYSNFFGPRITNNFLGKLFLGLVRNNSTSSIFDEEISPVYAKDLAKEIVRINFLPESRKKIFCLSTKKVFLTDFLTIAKKTSPSLTFFIQPKSGGEIFPEEEESREVEKIQVDSDLEEGIEETVRWFLKRLPLVNSPPETIPEKTTDPADSSPSPSSEKLNFLYADTVAPENKKGNDKDRKVKKKIIIGLGVFMFSFILFFVLPPFLFFQLFFAGIEDIVKAQDKINIGKYSEALVIFEKSTKEIRKAEKTFNVFSPFCGIVGLGKKAGEIENGLNFISNYANAEKYYWIGTIDTAKLGDSFIKAREVKQKSEMIGAIKANLSYAYQEASVAQSRVNEGRKGFLLLRKEAFFEKLSERLPKVRADLIKMQGFADLIPKIFAYESRKSYLLAIQNNFELRPSGGFLTAVAVTNLENGKMENTEVFNVYQLDKKLTGKVVPPEKIKKFLGEDNWFLRDANWFADFSLSAKKIIWFVDKEMQVLADGVISFDLDALKNILSVIGEVSVADFQEKINAENLSEKVIKYAELSNLSSGEVKKDFLSNLVKSMLEKAKTTNEDQAVGLWKVIFESLNRKSILTYFEDMDLQSPLAVLNWDGGLRNFQPTRDKKGVFADFLYLNEANVGVNQANYFIKRKVEQKIEIDEQGRVSEKLTLDYDNQSVSEKWPFGTYKVYLRVYLPKAATLGSILVNDDQLGLWQPLDSKSIEITEEFDKILVGLYFEVPAKTKKKVDLNYELGESFVFTEKVAPYLLMVQKQPGIGLLDYSLTFTAPPGAVPLRVLPKAVVSEKQLLISEKLEGDRVFQIDLAR